MRARLLIPAAAATALLSLAAAVFAQSPAPAALQTPAGLWQAVDDDTKQPTGWFLIANHDGVYSGIIAKMFLKPGEDPNAVCSECKDDRLNHPWLGLEIIRGMKQDPEKPEKYVDGTILDPRDGKVYPNRPIREATKSVRNANVRHSKLDSRDEIEFARHIRVCDFNQCLDFKMRS